MVSVSYTHLHNVPGDIQPGQMGVDNHAGAERVPPDPGHNSQQQQRQQQIHRRIHPVSYTHLDVYKRQVLYDSATADPSTLPSHANRPEIQQAMAEGTGASAVSYTHLDVYKRQV